jgi:hypothetical protein
MTRFVTVNQSKIRGQRYTPVSTIKKDTRLVTGNITAGVYGEQKSEGPKMTKGIQTIKQRMQNRIVPL